MAKSDSADWYDNDRGSCGETLNRMEFAQAIREYLKEVATDLEKELPEVEIYAKGTYLENKGYKSALKDLLKKIGG